MTDVEGYIRDFIESQPSKHFYDDLCGVVGDGLPAPQEVVGSISATISDNWNLQIFGLDVLGVCYVY